MKTIATDTCILPAVIADTVIRQLEVYLKVSLPADFAARLEERAEATYSANEQFRRRVRASGDKGRDYLYTFMRHWLAALVKEFVPEQFPRLPEGFAQGAEPPAKAA